MQPELAVPNNANSLIASSEFDEERNYIIYE